MQDTNTKRESNVKDASAVIGKRKGSGEGVGGGGGGGVGEQKVLARRTHTCRGEWVSKRVAGKGGYQIRR